MEIKVNGNTAHAATGGKVAEGDDVPSLVLVHGAGMNGTVWQMQTRYIAHRGVRVYAVDLPGHGGSEGEPLSSIGDMGDWIISFLDAAGLDHVVLGGHSMGSLVALEAAARGPSRVNTLVLLGSAAEMPVHPDLIAAAEGNQRLAPELVTDWGFGNISHKGGHVHPGLWAVGSAQSLLLGGNPGVLANDLKACNVYKDALSSAKKVEAPVHLICSDEDKMTPYSNAKPLIDALADTNVTMLEKTGHMMQVERPRECAKLLLDLCRV